MKTNDVLITASTRLPKLILDRAEELGLQHEELMRLAGIEESEFQDPEGRIDMEKIRHLWWTILERLPDPALGIRFGQASVVRELGVVGYAMANSLTLRRLDGPLAGALEELPAQERTAFLLRSLAGFDCREIGSLMGVPKGTVVSWLFRARKRLRRRLAGYARSMGFREVR